MTDEERDLLDRVLEEVAELRSECFNLAAELELQKSLVQALEDVVKATAGLRDQA